MPECKICPVQDLCTTKSDGCREIQRSEYADAVEANNNRYTENPELYRKRQEINERILGPLKRQWRFNLINLRGLEKVNGEQSLIMLVYNIKQTMNILGVIDLVEKLKICKSPYKRNDFTFFF